MKQLIKVWTSRLLVVGLIVFAGWKWGPPLYKQYFTHEKKVAFVPTGSVKEGMFTVSFHEMGNLEAEKSVIVTSMVQGKIIKLVQDGTVANQGDLIAQLDTEEMAKQVRAAKMDYENSLSDVKRADADLVIYKAEKENDGKKTEMDMKFAQSELERAQKELEKKIGLANDKLIPRDEVTAAEITVRSKELELEKRKMDWELQQKKILSDIALKSGDVQKVQFMAQMKKTALEEVEQRVKQSVISAPAGGLVILSETWDGMSGRRKIQEGDQVHPQMRMCTLPDLSKMLVKVNLGESDAPRAHLGMPVLIRLDAVPNKVYHGTVKTIDSLAKRQEVWDGGTGQKKIEVTIAVKESDPRLIKPGMTADVEFIVNSVDKAVYVPMEAVFEREGKTCLFVKDGKDYKSVPVKTGLSNDNAVVIKEGVEKGQIVALRDPTKITAGEGNSEVKQSAGNKGKAMAPVPGAEKD